jgi:hypothetical protein
MPSGRPNGFGAPSLGVTALWVALTLATPARASTGSDHGATTPVSDAAAHPDQGDGERPPKTWFSLGLITGTTQFDAGLADYQWDVTPRLGLGARALVGRGRLATGLRLWRASSTQAIGDLGRAPDVHATSWELVGEGRLAEVLGTQVLATAGAGRLRLGYDPDRITIQPPGAPSPIVVDLVPVATWIGGGGLALRRAVAPAWTVGLGLDARVFTIDTAHRAGDEIVYARESFGDWSARCELAWRVGPR